MPPPSRPATSSGAEPHTLRVTWSGCPSGSRSPSRSRFGIALPLVPSAAGSPAQRRRPLARARVTPSRAGTGSALWRPAKRFRQLSWSVGAVGDRAGAALGHGSGGEVCGRRIPARLLLRQAGLYHSNVAKPAHAPLNVAVWQGGSSCPLRPPACRARRATLQNTTDDHYLRPITSSGRGRGSHGAPHGVQGVAGSKSGSPDLTRFLTEGNGGSAAASAGRRHIESGACPADIAYTYLRGGSAGLSIPTPAPCGRDSAGPK